MNNHPKCLVISDADKKFVSFLNGFPPQILLQNEANNVLYTKCCMIISAQFLVLNSAPSLDPSVYSFEIYLKILTLVLFYLKSLIGNRIYIFNFAPI